ncbi:MAG: hypothetical protein CVU05_10220 [Bacteroidetes bacterium HGW-Bacteroidetes-21]|jgi:hypothetical protein|nr:MAG: hypothetical protein CVU05_10220 [Bacteroidetes bacterium HGW-Bacteroidetes-21]
MKLILYIILFSITFNVLAQKWPKEQIIETDSSTIKIIRNSSYKEFRETYKYKDSIRYIVWYIDDTTQIHSERWLRKNYKSFNISREYNKDGALMYEWDHNNGTCIVNKTLYPYHYLLEEMKIKADSLIINTYGKAFFDKHIKFEFNCFAYFGHWKTINTETFYTHDYLGSWMEPLKSKPNSFLFSRVLKSLFFIQRTYFSCK